MPIRLDTDFLDTTQSPRIDALRYSKQALLVWWYCGVLKNPNDSFQPLVKVAFKVQISENEFSDGFQYYDLPIELLGLLRIGSLWRDGRIVSIAQFVQQEFDVLHEKGMYWFTSFYNAANRKFSPPFPQEHYSLHFKHDKNWMVGFKLRTNGTLLIPTLEYFTRCYGRSGKLRRYLTAHKWTESGLPNLFFEPTNQRNEQGKWKINLRKGFYNGDAVFLAHLKYDPITLRAAKRINSEIDAQYKNGRQIPAFPKIGPWYSGEGKLLVRGIPFNNGKSFLGLQILGVSEPAGQEIEKLRDNRNNAVAPAGFDAAGNAWSGAPIRRSNIPPEIVDLTVYETPDQGAATHELEDPSIMILGERRKVKTLRDEQAQDRGGASGTPSDSDAYSSSDPHGSNKGVGQASINTPEITQSTMESAGPLRDIWNAALHLKETYQQVTKVEWYTPKKGFSESDEPLLMPLRLFNDNATYNKKPIPSRIRNWLFLDKETQIKRRGLLVIRLKIGDRQVHIIEIQRRTKKVIKKDRSIGSQEIETFRGLVFAINSSDNCEKWINKVRSDVRILEGKIAKLITRCPGKADVFKHSHAKDEEVPGCAAIINALRKMDILIDQKQKTDILLNHT